MPSERAPNRGAGDARYPTGDARAPAGNAPPVPSYQGSRRTPARSQVNVPTGTRQRSFEAQTEPQRLPGRARSSRPEGQSIRSSVRTSRAVSERPTSLGMPEEAEAEGVQEAVGIPTPLAPPPALKGRNGIIGLQRRKGDHNPFHWWYKMDPARPTPHGYDHNPTDPALAATGQGFNPDGGEFTARQISFFAFNQGRIDAARARDAARGY